MTWSSFHIMRHCITDANEAGRLQGQTENASTALNATGRAQALAIIPTLQRVGFNGVIASPLQRTRQTAEIINKVLQLPLTFDADLQEKHFGPLCGLTEDEADCWRQANPHLLGEVEPETRRPHVQGMEPYQDFKARGLSVMQKYLQNFADQKLLVITHGAFIRMLCRAFEITRDDRETPNAQPYHFEHTPPDGWRVTALKL